MGDVAASFVKGLNPFKLKENTLNETLDSFKSGVNSKNVREWAKAQGLNDSQVEAVVKYVDAEKGKKETAEAQKFASDNKALATLKSAITNASESTVNTLDKTASFLEGSPITNNARLNTTNAMREEVSKDMGKVGKFLYGTGNSILDMGTAMATSVGTGGSSLVSAGLMGLEKASEVMNEATERGLTPSQIILEGFASGVTTFITEKLPFDNLAEIASKGLTEKGSKALAKFVVKTALPEGAQEVTEDIADTLADIMIAGFDKSQIGNDINELVNRGISKEVATKQVLADWAKQTALDGLGGAISGGVVGGISLGANRLNNRTNTEVNQNEQTEVEQAPITAEEVQTIPEAQTMPETQEQSVNVPQVEEQISPVDNIQQEVVEPEIELSGDYNGNAPVNANVETKVKDFAEKFDNTFTSDETKTSQLATNTFRKSAVFGKSKEALSFLNEEIKTRITRKKYITGKTLTKTQLISLMKTEKQLRTTFTIPTLLATCK